MGLIDLIAETRIRLGIGQSYFNDVKNALLMSASIKVVLNLSVFYACLLLIAIMGAFWLTGVIDLNYFKIYQRTAELNTSKYNPHLAKIK